MIKLLFFEVFFAFSQTTWHRLETKHFYIFVEGKWNMSYISMELEKIYSIMRMNLNELILGEGKKVSIYIFENQEGYIKSEFKPSKWSEGMCLVDKNIVATYYQKEKGLEKLIEIIAHELTHLYLRNFFKGREVYIPSWLDEGLSVYIQSLYEKGNEGWTRYLKETDVERFMKIKEFFSIDPDKLQNQDEIMLWYLQSYSLVRFLYTSYNKKSFLKFLKDIKDGFSIEDSLRRNYKIPDIKMLEERWKEWMKKYQKKDEEFRFKPFKTIEFK